MIKINRLSSEDQNKQAQFLRINQAQFLGPKQTGSILEDQPGSVLRIKINRLSS
jgi:hypothetical protein